MTCGAKKSLKSWTFPTDVAFFQHNASRCAGNACGHSLRNRHSFSAAHLGKASSERQRGSVRATIRNAGRRRISSGTRAVVYHLLHVIHPMRFLNLTLDEAAANIALDDALLETAELAHPPLEILRLWEPRAPIVVVGRSSAVEREVRLEACRASHAPVVRRSSGGLSVVAGPGCLMYALVLSYELRPALRQLDIAHQQILGTLVAALRPLAPEIAIRGTSDLELGGRKVSGNSVRCKRRCLLYHGTLLYDFPLPLIGRLLQEPPRSPDYRAGRCARRLRGQSTGRAPGPSRCADRSLGCPRAPRRLAASAHGTTRRRKVRRRRLEFSPLSNAFF